MIISFSDTEDYYGIIETEENVEKIRILLGRYKSESEEDYNIDDFYLFLKDKGIKFRQIVIDKDIYF